MKNTFKILLVYPNIPGMLVVSIAFGLFTAILRKAGFEVDLFDSTLYLDDVSISPEKRVEYLQARKFSYENDLGIKMKNNLMGDFRAKVEEFNPDLLVISVVEDAFLQALGMIDAVKDKNITHIMGGIFTTVAPEKVMSFPQVKMIGIGEGEEVVLEVAQKLRTGESLDNVKNLWIKKEDGTIIKNPVRPLIDFNKLVFPDYSLFEKIRLYRPMGGKIFKTIPLETTRGCPFQCTFCNSPTWSSFYRQEHQGIFLRSKNIDRLIAEIKHLAERYNPELFYIIDDTFLARPDEELRRFAQEYSKFKIPFWINTRPETITQEKLQLLKDMNCYRMSIGIECGNEEFRKNKLKRFASNQDIAEKIGILAKSGLTFSLNNIIGFPEETRELIFETIEFNRQLSGYDTITVSIFTPYHGTKLREEAVQKGYLDERTITTHTTSSSLLRMPHLSPGEINGLIRTFALYVKFPKSEWDRIKIAEKFDEEGNRIFEELKKIYQEKYFK